MTVRHAIVLGLLALLGTAFWTLASGYVPDTELNRSALYYAQNTASETGAQNVVAAIIVTYRGLDTLGEVTVLFLTSAIIGLVLAVTHSPGRSAGSGSGGGGAPSPGPGAGRPVPGLNFRTRNNRSPTCSPSAVE